MIDQTQIQQFSARVNEIKREIGKEIIGQEKVVDQLLTVLIAGGNALLEGVPGLGKTRLVRTLSQVFDMPFSRIQFTPDLMPADITGTNIIVKTESGNEFRFREGPLFASIVLADEISPDTCRFWDSVTQEKLDKDRFRRDLGGVEDAYQEVLRRLLGE